MKSTILKIAFAINILFLSSCKSESKSGKLILRYNDKEHRYAYYNSHGNKVLGDYFVAFTDTITDYGIVADPGFVLIDKTGKHIYDIYPVDCGPDYTSEGIYRIVKNDKIGYVDSLSSKILIEPKFDCAYPFENGKAKVSYHCKKVYGFPGDEHPKWESNEWFYVDKNGNVVK